MTHKLIKTDNYLLVIDDSEIKEGKTFLTKEGIIHTNIGWNYGDKVITAHLPLNGSPILEGVPLLPPIQDDVEKLAKDYVTEDGKYGLHDDAYRELLSFTAGYNKAREKYKYTDEDMRKAISETRKGMLYNKKYEDEYIESLHQYPTEFECEMVWTNTYDSEVSVNSYDVQSLKPKTITTAQGIQWVGKYVF